MGDVTWRGSIWMSVSWVTTYKQTPRTLFVLKFWNLKQLRSNLSSGACSDVYFGEHKYLGQSKWFHSKLLVWPSQICFILTEITAISPNKQCANFTLVALLVSEIRGLEWIGRGSDLTVKTSAVGKKTPIYLKKNKKKTVSHKFRKI